MPYALVPIIDVGPSRLPWVAQRRMPLGLDQGGNCIHLGNNFALLWTPDPIADVRVETLADAPTETLAATTRNRLTTLAGDGRAFPVGRRQFAQAIRDLLVNAPVDGRWGPLVSTKDGRLEAYLGPGGVGANVLFREAVAPRGPASKDITDNFNRTSNLNGSTTSDAQTTWVEDQGTTLTVDGDEVDLTGAVGFCVGRLALAMDTADHYAEADLSRYGYASAVHTMGVFVRGNAAPTSGYGLEIGNNNPTNLRRVYNFVTDADLEPSDATAPSLGLIYLELDGSTYTAKVAGATIFTGTNTAHDGTVKGVGIFAYSNGGGNSSGFTSFRGADLVSAGVTDGWKILLH